MHHATRRAIATGVTGLFIVLANSATTQAQTSAGALEGPLEPGRLSLVSWGGGTMGALVEAAAERKCRVQTVWVTDHERFISYVPGAPRFVNDAFLSLIPADRLPAMPVIVKCAMDLPVT